MEKGGGDESRFGASPPSVPPLRHHHVPCLNPLLHLRCRPSRKDPPIPDLSPSRVADSDEGWSKLANALFCLPHHLYYQRQAQEESLPPVQDEQVDCNHLLRELKSLVSGAISASDSDEAHGGGSQHQISISSYLMLSFRLQFQTEKQISRLGLEKNGYRMGRKCDGSVLLTQESKMKMEEHYQHFQFKK
ncbi:hypothetical protein PR202_ga25140 [Eleusine coracana subsp. coracana]|uniref:Uncharacterized protein n=1 Tax=Eleusine coracana subsp. coracana TaxID=191504 RepID=A0AAV5D8L2_ELECO|nr:hypothetical protein PR202_ga25140 [Eleusine coracana subsp. coracana]